jgi:hypothetical protein
VDVISFDWLQLLDSALFTAGRVAIFEVAIKAILHVLDAFLRLQSPHK